jgi:toxin ParE1/3/4
MYSLITRPRALAMIQKAYQWYEEQKQGLGEEFLAELQQYYRKLQAHPEYFGKQKKTFRQAVLKRFPYVITYKIIKTKVVVFGVFHTRRNSKFKFRN